MILLKSNFKYCYSIMKNPFYLLLCLLSFKVIAQAPQGIPYQAIARNASGVAISNTAVKVRFSIRDSIASGTIKYQETHNPTTSALGLFSVNVGMGMVVSGTFSGINWGKNAKFLQVEMDLAGGNNYTDLGTTQMMSVLYALYSGQTFSSSGGIGSGFTMNSNFSPGASYTIAQTIDYCYNLVEGGYSDWRLPALSEVLVYFSSNGVMDSTGSAKFFGWTLTENGNSSGSAYWWFIDGSGYPRSASPGGNPFSNIKCVR
jgi:hypothetical protein